MNLASRLEQATKRVNAPIVVTQEVVLQLAGEAIEYRLCQAQLAGIEQPIALFAILPPSTDGKTLAAVTQYEKALVNFELGDLEEAKTQLQGVEESSNLPIEFLLTEIECEHHRRLGRRASDERTPHDSQVISLSAK